MNNHEIEDYFLEIKEKIKNGRIKDSIEHLEKFISRLDDSDDLDDHLVSLSSRFNILERESRLGTVGESKGVESNEIIRGLMLLLREAKQTAIEEESRRVSSRLSSLAEEGESAIDKLKELNQIMAESKLLELTVMRATFGNFFSEKQQDSFDENITKLESILGKLDNQFLEKENKDSTLDFISRMHNKFSSIIPDDPKPTVDDILDLVKGVKAKIDKESDHKTQTSD